MEINLRISSILKHRKIKFYRLDTLTIPMIYLFCTVVSELVLIGHRNRAFAKRMLYWSAAKLAQWHCITWQFFLADLQWLTELVQALTFLLLPRLPFHLEILEGQLVLRRLNESPGQSLTVCCVFKLMRRISANTVLNGIGLALRKSLLQCGAKHRNLLELGALVANDI